ncbi:hypothetical protein BKA65DRAFT_129315 [Rhexocercosporidium sp. MPI-PUGE-AT-0058]|nr:hypothetical protein BKA65DRAFT_129315 [Rhexocercosporidium sp. MPI-PUGE-AT-0058]
MQRNLTFAQDKFPALAGLARKVGEQTSYTYKAGIWLEQLHGGLLWHCMSPGKRNDAYVAPSWSWASMETLQSRASHVSWCFSLSPACTNHTVGPRAELLHCHVTLAGSDIYGLVLSGSISLRSSFLELSKWPKLWPIILSAGQWPSSVRNWGYELACHFDEQLPQWTERIPVFSNENIFRDIWILHIGNWVSNHSLVEGRSVSFFLLLTPVAGGRFRRLGTAEALLTECDTVQGWETRNVEII